MQTLIKKKMRSPIFSGFFNLCQVVSNPSLSASLLELTSCPSYREDLNPGPLICHSATMMMMYGKKCNLNSKWPFAFKFQDCYSATTFWNGAYNVAPWDAILVRIQLLQHKTLLILQILRRRNLRQIIYDLMATLLILVPTASHGKWGMSSQGVN